jgi:hypothetical protein
MPYFVQGYAVVRTCLARECEYECTTKIIFVFTLHSIECEFEHNLFSTLAGSYECTLNRALANAPYKSGMRGFATL